MRIPRRFGLLANVLLAIALLLPAVASASGNTHSGGGAPVTQLPQQNYLNHFVQGALDNSGAAGHLPAGFTAGPTSHDITYLMLRRLLGQPVVSVLDDAFNRHGQKVGGVTALTLTLGLFPYIALFVSSVLIIYWITAGTFVTTATGELLGKKWDSWALPTRSTFAYLMLLPLPPFAPLCGIQALVLALSLLGIGAGSAFFDVVVNYLVSTPVVIVSDTNTGRFINQVAHSELCLALGTQNGVFKPSEDKIYYKQGTKTIGLDSSDTQKVTRVEFGPYGGACGSYVLNPLPPEPKSSLAAKANWQIAKTLHQQQAQILHSATVATNDDLIQPMVSGVYHQNTGQYAAQYWALTHQLQSQITAAINTVRTHNKPHSHISNLARQISRSGFVTAGTVYWTLERRQDAFANAIKGYLPQVAAPLTGEVGNEWIAERFKGGDSSPLSRIYAADTSMLNAANQRYHVAYTPQGSLDNFYTRTSSEGTVGKALSIASTWVAQKIVKIPRLGAGSTAANPNPLLEIKMLGQQLEDAIIGLEVVSHLGSIADAVMHPISTLWHGVVGGGSSSSSGGFGGGLGTLLNVVMMVAFGLGFLYANIIPMMPYVLWTVAVIGYLIYLIGMLVGSPFWISMKAHPEGEGLIGRAGAGYPMVLTLILYPILMVTGLVAGMAIMRVGGWLINTTLWTSFSDMSVDGFNILSMVGKLAIYAILYMTLTWKAFAQTWELPQVVLQMMGVNNAFTDLGEKDAKGHADQIASRVTAGIGTALGRSS